MTDRMLLRRVVESQRRMSSIDAGLWVFLVGAVALTAIIGYCEMCGFYAPLRP